MIENVSSISAYRVMVSRIIDKKTADPSPERMA